MRFHRQNWNPTNRRFIKEPDKIQTQVTVSPEKTLCARNQFDILAEAGEGEEQKDEDSNIIPTMVNNEGEKKEDINEGLHMVETSPAKHIQEGLNVKTHEPNAKMNEKDATIEKVVTLAQENSRDAKTDQATPTKQAQYRNQDQNNMLQLTVHAENVEETDDNMSEVTQDPNTVLHNIVSHNIEDEIEKQGLIEKGENEIRVGEQLQDDGDLSPRLLKSLKSAKKGKKQNKNNLPVRIQPKTINKYRRRLSAPKAIHNRNGKIWVFVNNGFNDTVVSNSDQQLSLMDNLYSLSTGMTTPWIVGGDFNVVLNGKEKIGGIPVTAADIEDF
ncbi:hypothetical protein H5410_041752 [Solanum commersonii]|uniref:Uncharacterized protein n=1 Tax=Solanum commersonii TaxID=4109 RepID=A0A9J5XWH0_SOLCO|nr:hypothetical protein H5410_041752 [Solanum commersonii]